MKNLAVALLLLPGLLAGFCRAQGNSGLQPFLQPTLPEAATSRDRWHIGSDSKAFTATLIARLVEQGRVSLMTRLPPHFRRSPRSWIPNTAASR
ncbi:MAG: serine hydrolase [Steroidobacteraceae bacterium]